MRKRFRLRSQPLILQIFQAPSSRDQWTNSGFFKNGKKNDIVVLPNNEVNHNEKFSITQSNQENLPKGTNKLLNFNRDDIVNLNT